MSAFHRNATIRVAVNFDLLQTEAILVSCLQHSQLRELIGGFMVQHKIVSVLAFGFFVSTSQAQAAPGTFYCWGIDKAHSKVFLTDIFSRDMGADESMRELSLGEGRQFDNFLRSRGVDPSPTYCMPGGFSHYVKQLRDGFSQGRIVRSEWKPSNVERAINLIDHPELHAKYETLTPGAPLPVIKAEKSDGGYLVVEDKKSVNKAIASAPTKTPKPPAKVRRSVGRGSFKSKCHVEGKKFVCPGSKQ